MGVSQFKMPSSGHVEHWKKQYIPSACFPGCQSSNIFISPRKAAPFHNIYFRYNWVLFLSNKSSGAGYPEMSHNTYGLVNRTAAISRGLTEETKAFWWPISSVILVTFAWESEGPLVPPQENTGKKKINFSLSLNRLNQLEVHTKNMWGKCDLTVKQMCFMNRTLRSNYSQLVLERPTFFHSERKMCLCVTLEQ